MSSSFSIHSLKALPSLSSTRCVTKSSPLCIICKHKPNTKPAKLNKQKFTGITQKAIDCFDEKKSSLGIQAGAVLLAALEQPALAVTGENNHEIDLTVALIKVGIIAFWYFLIMPPIIMNWLRVRWYKRKLFEMYVQFMFVFMFFPGLLLWAPFLNFRKLPRDPSMKAPWDTPADPSKVKNAYLKFPWAQVEDYE
ncbi:NAD(P)H-quinone oxidoreductase subunit L, chloroplastic isoform X1 [Citrus sinensis]|uniref:NAD(P)H-quinone oxidoreductase subunit L, chloroplastic isoform X1 n=1 Tax=Citrus sinensis TaxID=2711 RepID=UPI0003D78460|nr:NAD(P)H-quinone oxidoreductase subunit L, chloroplastic isoform X1 [Citrus sinensis]